MVATAARGSQQVVPKMVNRLRFLALLPHRSFSSPFKIQNRPPPLGIILVRAGRICGIHGRIQFCSAA
jgi:hypothetical protein